MDRDGGAAWTSIIHPRRISAGEGKGNPRSRLKSAWYVASFADEIGLDVGFVDARIDTLKDEIDIAVGAGSSDRTVKNDRVKNIAYQGFGLLIGAEASGSIKPGFRELDGTAWSISILAEPPCAMR